MPDDTNIYGRQCFLLVNVSESDVSESDVSESDVSESDVSEGDVSIDPAPDLLISLLD